jgi:enterochelin esterase-like enzyme
MSRKTSHPAGTVSRHFITSEAIANNMLGEDLTRIVDVYVPAGHDGKGLPLLVDLVGYTSGGPYHTAWKSFGENLPERLDRLIGDGTLPPCVVAFPDCFTRMGGNQYINSPAMGNWADLITGEMVPMVEAEFSCGGDGRRGVFGKSSGGYGAMVHALLYPDFWAGAICHSGDMGFDLIMAADFANTLRRIAKHGGTIESFIAAFESADKPAGDDMHALMILCDAATYDPDPSAFLGLRLPVTMDTCEIIPERWANWMKWDPLSLVKIHGKGLSKLKGLFIDCGDIDQYNLLYGARRMTRELTQQGIAHEYAEFPDTHSGVDYRMDISLPWLVKRLNA